MYKKIKFSILFILCVAISGTMLFFGVNTIKAQATERAIVASGIYGEVTWSLYDDGELYIGGEGVIGKPGNNSSVPWHSKSSEITQITIGKDAVYNENSTLCKNNIYSSLTKISVEEGNTSLSTDENGILFNNNKSALILFPASSSLSEYSIPDIVMQLADYSFYGSNLKKIVIGESVSKIGQNAFSNCDNLTDLTFWAKSTSLEKNIFSDCDSLESVKIPEGISVIPSGMFSSCEKLKEVVLHNKLKTINDSAFADCINLSEIDIPSSVSSIGRYTFKNCKKLESVEIPSQVKKIDFSVFQNCISLKNVILGKNTTTVENDSFNGCESIENVEISSNISAENLLNVIKSSKKIKNITINTENDHISCDENSVLFNKDKTELIRYPLGRTDSSYIIPDTVKRIRAIAFKGSTALTDITIPESVEYIGTNAFLDSGFYKDDANWDNGFLYIGTNLIAVDSDKINAQCRLYSKTTLVASRVFEKCNITSLDMSDNVKHINEYAFTNCDNLESVRLSSNLETLGTGAFYDCDKLKEIEIPEKVSVIENLTFCGSDILCKVILNEKLTSIDQKAFYSTPMLTEIHIPKTVVSIDSTAFESSGIKDIYFDDTKAQWKRLANGATFNNATIHYTLRSNDESVIIHHTDNNFDREAGNVHLVIEDLGDATSSYEQNGFYNRLMVDPIQVLDIKLVDGDGNNIQPLSDEKITVKIKASEEFMNLMKSGLSAVSDYNIEAEKIDFVNDCFVFEIDGETVSVPAEESFLKKFKIIHWYSDATEPTDHESFTHDELSVENGYIVIETNHFSEYAVCTEYTEKKDYIIRWIVDGVVTEQTVTEEASVTKPVSPQKEGYTFVGWTPEVPETMPAENLEFNAVWKVNEYTITFDTAGGTKIDPLTLEYGAAVTAPANPEKEGYTFIGWSPEIPETMPANDLTVVAEYKLNETPADPDEPDAPEITVTDIKVISTPAKTSYNYKNKNLDLSGLVIKISYSDGSSKIISNTSQIKTYGFNSNSVGTKTITVEYGGYTDEFEITVSYAWWQWIIRILLLGFLWY